MRQLRLRHDIKVKSPLSSAPCCCWTGSLPLRLTHGRADACLQAGHSHYALRVHQGFDYRSQARSLDPLVAVNPGSPLIKKPVLTGPWDLPGSCIKDLLTHSRTHYWARRNTELPEITNGQILLKIVHKCQAIFLQKNNFKFQESGLSHSFACLWHCGNVLQILKCFAAFKN